MAQYNLCLMYLNGNGVAKDSTQAAIWCRKAAEQGLVKAQLMIGSMYWVGDGVAKDAKQTAIWYRKAADQGKDQGEEPEAERPTTDETMPAPAQPEPEVSEQQEQATQAEQ